MYNNISQRIAERVAVRSGITPQTETTKSFNEEYTKILYQVRRCEDQLLSQQYKFELISQENENYIKVIQRLDCVIRQQQLESKNEIIKNSQIKKCEENLIAIHREMDMLKEISRNKDEELGEIQGQKKGQFQANKRQILQKEQIMKHQSFYLNMVKGFLNKKEINSNENLLNRLREYFRQIKAENKQKSTGYERVKAELEAQLQAVRQHLLKIQYEWRLESERDRDHKKQAQMIDMTHNEQHMESILDNILQKQSELKDHLQELEQRHSQIKYEQQSELHQIEITNSSLLMTLGEQISKIRQQLTKSNRYLDEVSERCKETASTIFKESRIVQIKAEVQIDMEYMKKYREVEQKNHFLKLRIEELKKSKFLLETQKELLFCDV